MKITHKTFSIKHNLNNKSIVFEQLFWFGFSIVGQVHYADSLISAKKLKKELHKKEKEDLIKRESNFFLCITFLFLLINFIIFAE